MYAGMLASYSPAVFFIEGGSFVPWTRRTLANLAHLRRARDLIDREYARPLDVPTMAGTR